MIGEIQAVPSRPAEAQTQASSELRKIAGEFETVFSKMLLASMRKTVQKTPLFHAGRGEEIFSELLDDNYSAALSKKGKGLGIAEMIVKKYAAHVKAQEEQEGREGQKGRSLDKVKKND
ncbi:MAG TPA: rod-binding protein [Planctomycetota bacterium]|nr:rod-binding protein [Planctomycetota bacterium]